MSHLVAQLDVSELHGGRTAPGGAARVADNSPALENAEPSRPIWMIILCGILLVVAIAVGTGVMLSHLRSRALTENEREIQNIALVLAKQMERDFDSVVSVQASLIERIKALGISSSDDFEKKMSDYDAHLMLKDKVVGFNYLGALVLVNSRGKAFNFSRSWPIPDINAADRDYFTALQSDKNLDSFVTKPFKNRATGTWIVQIARKVSGPNGKFLGLVLGAIELQSIEQYFARVALGPDSAISLIHHDGELMARHPSAERLIGRPIPGGVAVKLVSNSDQGLGRRIGTIGNPEDRLVAAHRVGHYPFLIAATTSVAAVLADWWRTAIYLIGIAALSILVVAAGIFLLVRQFKNYASIERARAEKIEAEILREQSLRLDAALENISQGMVMYDSMGRLVICNDRYRQMCKLPPDLAKPGSSFLDIIKCRAANGSFFGNPEEYVGELMDTIAKGKTKSREIETDDGRTIYAVNQPLAGGGWVATHEDITERKQAQTLIEESHKNLERAETVALLGHTQFEQKSGKYTWSAGVYRIMGKSPASYIPTPDSALELIHHEDRPALAEYRRDVMVGLEPPRKTLRAIRDDGQIIYVEFWSVLIRARDGSVTGKFSTLRDVTKYIRAEEALTRANQDLIEKQYAIDQAVITAITDVKGNITYVNDKFCQISGYAREELLGQNHRILSSGTYSEMFFRDMYCQIANGEVWRGELCNKAKDGSLYWVDTTIVPQLGPAGKPVAYMAIRIDITARKQAETQISYIARHDSLTGLANRAVLHEKMEEALARLRRRQEEFSIFLLDLDGFKHINDSLGHAAGDELLMELSRRLTFSLRETDFLARLGGDEFAIIQGGGSNQREEAIALAGRVLEVVAQPFNLNGHNVTIATSIGITVAPEDGTDAGELLKKADLALYRVKSEGRNNFCFFDAEMSKGAGERMHLLSDMRAALTRKEFELYYQPIVDAKTSRPCGAEALVRWRHPVHGMMPPDRFIPLAEETGLMEPLGEWILEQACTDAAAWPDHIKIAVNLSAVQFRSGKLFDVILCALVESGLPPERLELEITESVLMQDAESHSVVLQKLKNIGVSIALDDFGTGYSSLSYLTTFPFDKIKIDKAFTQGLTSRADCAAIVASVLTLARGLDMTVTAEGVETKQQFELLRAAGVHQIQGYLFARPGPLAELNFTAIEQKGQVVAAA